MSGRVTGSQHRRLRGCTVGAVLLVGWIVLPADLPAAATAPDNAWTCGFGLDNDLFAGTDRHYTNGWRLSCLSDTIDGRIGGAIGQSIFTPRDITRATPSPQDRPYAGWLYARVTLVAEHPHLVDRFDLDLGVVGPASLARETQDLVHRVIGSDRPRGWSHQLRNEPGVVLSYQRAWPKWVDVPLGPLRLDLAPFVGGSLGNVFTDAGIGATVRFGYNLPESFGPSLFRAGGRDMIWFQPPTGFGIHAFATAEGRAVLRNIFLDGNTFEDSPSVSKKPLVGDVQVGLAVNYGWLTVAFGQNVRTPEFRGQRKNDGFGSVSIAFRF